MSRLFLGSEDTSPVALALSDDGNTLMVSGENTRSIYEYNLQTSFSVATAVFVDSLELDEEACNTFDLSYAGIDFGADGRELYGVCSFYVDQYSLPTAYHLSGALLLGNTSASPLFISSTTDIEYVEQTETFYLSNTRGTINNPSVTTVLAEFASYKENVLDNGSLDNDSPLQITLVGTVFQDDDNDNILDSGTEVEITNLPEGFVPVFTLSEDDTVLTLTIEGSVIRHQERDSVDELKLIFHDSAFATTGASGIIFSGGGEEISARVGIDFVGETEAVCGDGEEEFAEACDDTNMLSGDGCSDTCEIESGYICSGSPSICELSCSNGSISFPEQCDDGNIVSGDGCSDTCEIESGYICSGSPSICELSCSNGSISFPEQCDDGNIVSGDGCSDTCEIESGYICSGSPSVCELSCSNGSISFPEQCDDGNIVSGDGCSDTCSVESGYVCTGEPSECEISCGNGQIDLSEQCDDGNTISGDGCDGLCRVEIGYSCAGVPSVCDDTCGNDELDPLDQCDDGGNEDGDGCSAICRREMGCGDGSLVLGEACDDNNLIDGDGCDRSCEIEEGYFCEGSPSSCSLLSERDSDRDGLTDVEELELGTDPDSSDSDNDGVDDGQELLDGSSPTDSGSILFKLQSDFCAEWNGFLGMTANISEFTNLSSEPRVVGSTLFNLEGEAQESVDVQIGAGIQFDLLVHDLDGWNSDSIGTVCTNISQLGDDSSEASSGDLDGRMMHYRPDGQGSFDFVVAIPFQNPTIGEVAVQTNTFYPSLNIAELSYFVANWFTVVNSSESEESGSIVFFSQSGEKLLDVRRTIAAGGRIDEGVHSFGAQLVGLVKWIPDSSTAEFRATLNRYFYQGDTAADRVIEAVSLPAVKSSSQELYVPLDTRDGTATIEISNTSEVDNSIDIRVTDASGVVVMNAPIVLSAGATIHFVLDEILDRELGLVYLNPAQPIIANGMQYGRLEDGTLLNLYTVPVAEGLGAVVRGSYNTFLEQRCTLIVGNTRGEQQEINIDAVRFDGEKVIEGEVLVLPANGVLEYDVCSNDEADTYGLVSIQPQIPGGITANIVRLGKDDNYRISLPVR